jgi:hypothetical protein
MIFFTENSESLAAPFRAFRKVGFHGLLPLWISRESNRRIKRRINGHTAAMRSRQLHENRLT